jgi:hypothetical protein
LLEVLNVFTAGVRGVAKVLLVDAQVVRRTGVLAVCVGDVVEHLAGQLDVVVGELADLCVVDAKDFGFLAGAEGEAGNQVHDEEDEASATEGVESAGGRVRELVAELDPVVVEPAAVDLSEAIEMGYVVSSKEACEDVANETTDGVFREDVQRIINTKDELELGGVVSTCGTDDTVDDCRPCRDETGAGSDCTVPQNLGLVLP